MNCEMCGKETELYSTSIEGVTLKVCKNCASYGRIIEKVKPKIEPRKISKTIKTQEPAEKEIVEAVVDDFAKKIRDARTKSGMTQKEFAKTINEKESILHKIETGSFKPPLPLAKRLEKMLHIKLIEEREEEKIAMPKQEKGGTLTIGDVLKA